ncbi:hypothetical protein SLEP1_g26446 [Rubroshorea leprosula]|uniref:Uncharacterized protein n=1 Tax=Rubroshorea leprosula TaxID=152421 RepID=A0AAV5JSI9_9ROSI|nr:hypothetical protein SLEP1_g26446 [Rubroshorea leprosula]
MKNFVVSKSLNSSEIPCGVQLGNGALFRSFNICIYPVYLLLILFQGRAKWTIKRKSNLHFCLITLELQFVF